MQSGGRRLQASACEVLRAPAAEWLRGGKRKGWVRKMEIGKKRKKKRKMKIGKP